MPDEYTNLVNALKALTQGEAPDPVVTLPMAENEWNTRPDSVSYGIVSLDFEADSLNGDDGKQMTSWQGSVDLFVRMKKDLERLKDLVENALEEVCEASWQVNSIQHESQTGYFHYEWVFEVE